MMREDAWGDPRQILTRFFMITLMISFLSTGYFVFTSDDQGVTSDDQGEPYTEFYLLDSTGETTDYPDELREGETGEVVVGITNQEHEYKKYNIIVVFEGRIVGSETVTLANGENREQTITFTPQSTGETQLEVQLYIGDQDVQSDEPYDTLRLHVDVLNPTIEISEN